MADRYPPRPGSQNPPGNESDPLAELARLIGQTDPFASFGRDHAQQPAADPYDPNQGHGAEHEQPFDQQSYAEEPPVEDNRPSWLRRVQGSQQPAPQPAAPVIPPWPQRPVVTGAPDPASDPARYNNVLFGQPQQAAPATGWPAAGHHAAYPGEQAAAHDDQYYDPQHYDQQQYSEQQYDQSYEQDAYPYEAEEDEPAYVQPRNGGLLTAIVVASLAVVGTASAFGYRYYHGSPRSGDAPIIYADKSPTKITPAQTADASGKINDRVGASGEQIVPREEQPVNVNATAQQPRVVFPAPGQSAATGTASVGAPTSPPPMSPALASALQNAAQQQASADAGQPSGNGAMDEPRKIKVQTIRGDGSVAAAAPTMVTPTSQPPATSNAAPTAATKRVTTVPVAAAPPTQPKPFTANQPAPPSGPGPLSLSPNAAPSAPTARTQVASVAPTATAPAPSAGGGYVVQVSSQRNEADAQNSYRALQSKYPSVLGSRSPFIKRVDLGDKGVYYRAMVGPFASSDEAGDFCGSLKSAGGNCFVQRN